MIEEKLERLVAIANSFIGVHEVGGNNSGPVVEMFQRVIGKAEKEPWCVSFIQYCVKQVDTEMGCHTSLFTTESSQMLWLKTPHIMRLGAPKRGSIVVYTKYHGDTPLSIGHVGIVTGVPDKDYISTVEGNTSPGPGLEREGDGVFAKKRLAWIRSGYMRTTGYLIPWAG